LSIKLLLWTTLYNFVLNHSELAAEEQQQNFGVKALLEAELEASGG